MVIIRNILIILPVIFIMACNKTNSTKPYNPETTKSAHVIALDNLTNECRKFRLMFVEMKRYSNEKDDIKASNYACMTYGYYELTDPELEYMMSSDLAFQQTQMALSGACQRDKDMYPEDNNAEQKLNKMMNFYNSSIKNCAYKD